MDLGHKAALNGMEPPDDVRWAGGQLFGEEIRKAMGTYVVISAASDLGVATAERPHGRGHSVIGVDLAEEQK
ncbi:hypothetical protein HNP40_003190 [Mycobacteroides chelonae]|nr:hypothetical protein [Mycobacteroides chelonae]